jgi:hypothetical protein
MPDAQTNLERYDDLFNGSFHVEAREAEQVLVRTLGRMRSIVIRGLDNHFANPTMDVLVWSIIPTRHLITRYLGIQGQGELLETIHRIESEFVEHHDG